MASIDDPQTPPSHRSRVGGGDEAEQPEQQEQALGSPKQDDDHDEDEETDRHEELPLSGLRHVLYLLSGVV